MNRCIHCTRCIRFGDEIAGIHEMVAIKRGNNIDITTIDGKQLQTEYAGNYSDICPTGSLTLKDFRFKKRAWMLKKTATICEGCSKGCNMETHHESNVIYRCIPRENLAINKYWLCDEGRFNYHYTQDPSRILEPRTKSSTGWKNISWDDAILGSKEEIDGQKPLFLIGTDLTLEEMQTIQQYVAQHHVGAKLLHFGTAGVETTAQDGPLDTILKMKSKTSNLNGAEKLGIAPLTDYNVKADTVFIIRGGRAQLPQIQAKRVIGMGVFLEKEIESFDVIMPGIAFTEKDGTIVNHSGIEQQLKRSVLPRGKCKPLSEVLMLLANKKSKVEASA